jgi:Tfp pilus assembly protein PilX
MRSRMKRQDGVALPVAVMVMFVMSLLVAAFFSLSLQTSDAAKKDRSSKRALAAAEAGLQSAVFRLNQIRKPSVPTDQCLTSGPTPPVAGECPGFTEQIGNGA